MFTKSTLSTNKVKFQDHQLDDYVLENSVIKSKLQSKLDALSIMTKELDKCRMERDRYKLLVEQLKHKKTTPLKNPDVSSKTYRFTPTNTISNGDILAKTRDHNYILKLEVETLQSKLEEAVGDIECLRKQLHKKEEDLKENSGNKNYNNLVSSHNHYELLVQELEKVQKKYQQLMLDYRATLDEKEELVSDRDYYKNKVQRLNQQISYILSNRIKSQTSDDEGNPSKPIVDIDALITENKYLNERITQLQVEKEIIKRTLNKYKNLLDNRSKNYSVNIKRGFADVMTQKQAREFLERSMKSESKYSSSAELKSLCLGLFEAMNDKSIALQHQRKTNQILANRITELEKTLESWCNGQKYIPIFPSQLLLNEFFPEGPDTGKTEPSGKSKELQTPDSDDEVKNSSDDSSGESKKEYENSLIHSDRGLTKTVLPDDLQELVKEALAELKDDKAEYLTQ